MKKITILHICYIDNNKCSGVSSVVPEYFLSQKNKAVVGLLNCSSIRVDKLKNEKNVFMLDEFKKIDKLPKPFNKPDIVVFHEVYRPVFVFLAKSVRRKKIPYIIVPHGCLTIDAQKIKKTKKIIANIILFNNYIYKANSIQFLSQSEREMSKKYANNSYICGNGMMDTNIIKNKFNDNIIMLIYIGRYSIYHKGLDILIEYCIKNAIFMRKKNIILNMYGSGNDGDREKLDILIKENQIDDIVKLNGPIFEKNKENELITHDYFIQLSRLEGQPLGVMEALMHGVPVIVSDGTTFKNYVLENNCGFICNNSDDFSNIIRNIAEKKCDPIKMSENARKFALKEFSWNKIAKETIQYYNSINIVRRKGE